MPAVIVVAMGVHVIPSGEVYTVDVSVPATQFPPPQAMLVHLMVVEPLLVKRSVHAIPSVDVRIDVEPAATHTEPFHAMAVFGSTPDPATDHSASRGFDSYIVLLPLNGPAIENVETVGGMYPV